MKRLALIAFAFAIASSCALQDAAIEQRRLPRQPEVDFTSVGPFEGWTDDPVPPAEERFKNIRVLQGLPSSELYPVMAFFSNSLGVGCDHCHTQYFDEEQKHTKQIARQMVLLTRAINEAQFQGEPTVTCYTCHDGKPYPSTVPSLAHAGWMPDPDPDTRILPASEIVLERYRGVAPGSTPISLSGTVTAIGGLGERLEGPFTLTWTPADGASVETSVEYPPPVDERLSELGIGLIDAEARYGSLDVVRREMIDGVEAITLMGESSEGIFESVSFDESRGHLLRLRTGTPTALGFVPEEIRFAGWKQEGPRTIAWARGDFLVTFHIQ